MFETDTTALVDVTEEAPKPLLARRLARWVAHWAETPYGSQALFLLAFAESSFFPIPPDVLLIALTLVVPRRWWRFAFIALMGSVLGGLFGYFLGNVVWQRVAPFFFSYVFSEEVFEKVRGLYVQYDFWAVFTAGLTPIPYKIFTIAAGACRINVASFTMASILSRGARFFVVAGLLRLFGPPMKELIRKYFNLLSIVFVVLLIGGFVLLKWISK